MARWEELESPTERWIAAWGSRGTPIDFGYAIETDRYVRVPNLLRAVIKQAMAFACSIALRSSTTGQTILGFLPPALTLRESRDTRDGYSRIGIRMDDRLMEPRCDRVAS